MSNSSLVSYTNISPNRTTPRKSKIDTITIHCVVGQLSVEKLGTIFAKTSRKASCNYGIGADGRIGMYCEEKDRSWCSSNAANDHRAITIECASDTTHPYAINNKVYNALIDLCVDICKRNDIDCLRWKADKSLIGKPEQQNMTVHRWFANKSCPGDYIYNRLGQIVNEVNKRLGVTETATQTGKTTEEIDVEMPTIKKGSTGKAVMIWQIIVGVDSDGDFGSKTLAATKKFQKKYGLTEDGIVGPKTWKVGLESV